MRLIMRNGNEVVYDVGKIVNALLKAAEALAPVFEEATEMVREAIDNIGGAMLTFARSLAHRVFDRLYAFWGWISTENVSFDPSDATRLSSVIQIWVRLLTASFMEHARVYRAVYLLRPQDRGGGANSNNGDFEFRTVLVRSLWKRSFIHDVRYGDLP